MPDVRPVAAEMLPDLEQLFSSDRSAASCWCMWFIIRVKEYHQGGGAANAAKFKALAASCAQPLGLIAYQDERPVGWAAAGPRARYARAIRTPTMKDIDHAEDDDVWLVPCLFVRPDLRGQGIARLLLRRAVEIATEWNASAIEGFPTKGARQASADRQVGTEHLFESCGFKVVGTPSSNRVVMRLELPFS